MKESSEELLATYARSQAEEAFRELVRRHIGVVYNTALRVANGDAHLAQDVAQTVFADLARKATNISSGTVVAGWLYQHAWFTAAKMIRTERRRQMREQTTMTMQNSASGEADHTDLESTLRATLDEALTSLKPEERDAVVLRYFEQAELRRIGTVFGISEDAAQKRVTRAVEKLRGVFAARGMTVSTAGLIAFLSSQSLAAPPALAGMVTSSALVGGSAAVGTVGIGAFLASTKGKVAVAVACAIAAGTPLAWQQRTIQSLREDVAQMRTLASSNGVLRAENERLRKETLSAADVEALNRDLLELQRLRGEVTLLRKQAPAQRKEIPNDSATEEVKEPKVVQVVLETRVVEMKHEGMASLLKRGFPGVADPKNFNLKMSRETAAAALRLFEETEGVDILAAPKLTTLDGREARVSVTDELALPDGTLLPLGLEVLFIPTVLPDKETTNLKINLAMTEFLGWENESKTVPRFRRRSVDHQESLGLGEVAILGRSVVVGENEEPKLQIYWFGANIVDAAGNSLAAMKKKTEP